MSNSVKILDTTLRDGQQAPGCGMSFEQNIEYALLADKLGIDVLEAGFPSASALDFDIVATIAAEMKKRHSCMSVSALCQLREAQVIRTIEALSSNVENARVHLYLPVDPRLMQASLGKRATDQAGLIDKVANMVKLAYNAGMHVEFSPEGYSNMKDNFSFVTDLIRAALANGASVINCPDTIGGACEWQAEEYFVNRMSLHAALFEKEFPDQDITWSVHCHNDFGLALINSMNAVFKGPARQVEGCINGVGERAGNAALEQCIMYIKQFGDSIDPQQPFYTNCDTTKLQEISDFIDKHMMPRQANWPIVGSNAARHSSGGHTNAVLQNPLAYQPFSPKDVGSKLSLVFGPLSGSNHVKSIIKDSGFICDESEKTDIAEHIKNLYQTRRKGITDREVIQGYIDYRIPIKAEHLTYSKTDDEISLHLRGKFFEHESLKIRKKNKSAVIDVLFDEIAKNLSGIEISDCLTTSNTSCAGYFSIIKLKHGHNGIVVGEADDSNAERSTVYALIDAANKLYMKKYQLCDSKGTVR